SRGLAKWVSGGEKISPYAEKALLKDTPAIFNLIDSRLFGGNIAVVTIVFLVCVAACWFLLGRTTAGRYIQAIGGNEEASRYSGVPVARIKILAYALSGFFAAVAGICQAAQEGQGDPEGGATYELTAIAMVVIGGTSLAGGRGGILLTLVGTLTIGYLEKVLSINAVSEAGRLMLTGLIIVGAVLLQKQNKR
ncbi:ABC transporter permease, partial [Candidatus Sumerlaeota bacterium]|nr:ABC transporter permease [Candidatus Sumerlaeota bacterium]